MSKLISMDQAVQSVAPGSTLGLGGMTLYRRPVAFARALLADPRILLLDEATSSVDVETEAVIQAAIDRLVTGRTTIAIAHRLPTLRRANRLVVLEAGRITARGTLAQLLKQSEEFRRLWEREPNGK